MSFHVLSPAQQESYQENGFLLLPHFISPTICELLIHHSQTLINEFDPTPIKTIFSTTDQRHAKDQYFLDSGDKIRFFFEEGALNSEGQLIQDKNLSINKIGHALHDQDPLFNCFSRSHKIATLVHDLGLKNPLLAQSMYICKQPYIGGEVVCHQDSTYLYVKDQPVIGLWIALQAATIDNGCLWAIPGEHHNGLKSRFIRNPDNTTHVETYDSNPWPLDKMIPLEVPQGSLIVLHGLLPHMSKENRSSVSRHAYSIHLISHDHHYDEKNWLQRPAHSPFKGFL